MKDESNYEQEVELYEEFKEVEIIFAEDQVPLELTCRFCFSKVCDVKNPLIGACNCSGSVRLIHVECLKQWLDFKK